MNAGTLKDVANRLNLSVSTVSRVVNGKGYVKEETRQRVLACLEACNYVPNEVARSLQARETMTIGVVVPDLCETYFGRIIKEIDRVVAEAGYMLMVTDTGESRQQERRYLDSLYQKRVDALVLSSVDVDDPNVSRYYASGTPVVFLDNLPHLDGNDVHYVMLDNHQASSLAVQTLIDRGHQQIALIVGSQNEPTGYERKEGYCRAMEENGLTVDENLVAVGNFKKDGGYRCMQKLLQNRAEHPFTAVYVTSEMMTIGALQAIREENLVVGEDIVVIGFDVHDDLGLANPTIACVCQPEAEVGRSVGRMLLQLLKPEIYGTSSNTKVWLQAQLQLGSSLGL
jgi:DNA-binding LacI/PurR family transcriptional regulator